MPEFSDLRLATDVGVTFTDTVLTDEDARILATAKSLTTHDNPALGALEGVKRILSDFGAEMR